MQIIAVVNDGTYPEFMVQASEDELRRIMGDRYKKNPRLRVGLEINVSEIFDHLTNLAALPRGVEHVQEKLAEMQEVLGLVGKVAETIALTEPEDDA